MSRLDHERDEAELQGVEEVELLAEFSRDIRSESTERGASAKEIGAAAPQLAGTRSRENEGAPFLFDECVHGIEEGWHALHFVDDDGKVSWRGGHALAQTLRAGEQFTLSFGVEQVEVQRLRVSRLQEARLPRTPGSEEEVGTSRFCEEARAGRHESILPCQVIFARC